MDKETKLKLALLRQKVEKLTGKKVKFIKESYMGHPGEEFVIQPSGARDNPTYSLINAKNYGQVDMFFSSPEEAKAYADKKGLGITQAFQESKGCGCGCGCNGKKK